MLRTAEILDHDRDIMTEWQLESLPPHLRILRRLFSSNIGYRLMIGFYEIGLLTITLFWFINQGTLSDMTDSPVSSSPVLVFLTGLLQISSLFLSPLAVRYIYDVLSSRETLQTIVAVCKGNPEVMKVLEWKYHMNLLGTIISTILYAPVFGWSNTIGMVLMIFLPIYLSITTIMLLMDTQREFVKMQVVSMQEDHTVNYFEIREMYIFIRNSYKLISNRDSFFLTFIMVYFLQFVLVCIGSVYIAPMYRSSIVGFLIVYFIYFIQVVVALANANETGQLLSIYVSDYILQRRQMQFYGIEACELSLFVSCITIVHPEISTFGFILRFRAVLALCSALLLSVIPKLFL